ncbi:Bardet-Biedl syndrome 2 protein-like [Oopsacas minuta]|uniref:Bardet-Biedl syndrome 2 protein-like n=1 Tax=Oopsacas minuta TaxID=111878 RepID=A0AAV7KKC1_9METZ|nr:Bardet-Biedl syndrome 2 protein-like [Oopsacas minuta]
MLPRFSVVEADLFSLHIQFNNESADPISSVSFPLHERTNRIVMWLNQNFLLPDKITPANELDIKLLSLRNRSPLFIQFKPDQSQNLIIQTDNIELAGQIVQSIAAFLAIEDLEVTANFPEFIRELDEIILKVEEFNSVREKISAEMADHSNLIRSLLIRAEDCRLLGNIRDMKKAYSQLMELNHDLITGYKIRTGNHLEFLECLKIVNQAIQKSGRLRVGKPKTQVVNGCRNAIKNNNFQGLAKIIKTGKV